MQVTLKHALRQGLVVLIGPILEYCLAVAGRLWHVRLWHLREDRIGHLAGDTDLYLRRRSLGDTEPGVRLLVLSGNPCNTATVDVLSRYLPIFRNRLLSKVYHLVEPYLWRTGYVIGESTRTTEYREFAAPALLTLTPDEEARGRAEIATLGIGANDWWVCFHARDTAYLNEGAGKFGYHSFRNHEITNMVPAMELVAAQGGFAVRMGSAVERPLENTGNPRIIDYAAMARTDFMDLYLAARCRFFVGSTSGLFHIPKAFGVPYIMTNLIGYAHLSPQPTSFFLPKLLCDRTGHTLSFAECANLGLFSVTPGVDHHLADFYASRGFEVIETSAEDIRDAVADMFDALAGRPADSAITERQRQFKDWYIPHATDRADAGNLPPSYVTRHWDIIRNDTAATAECAQQG